MLRFARSRARHSPLTLNSSCWDRVAVESSVAFKSKTDFLFAAASDLLPGKTRAMELFPCWRGDGSSVACKPTGMGGSSRMLG